MSASRGLAAVTGATGFLGQHLVRALADDGWRVRILARRDPISPFWAGITPEVTPGDLGDARALARLCEGADLVVHAAGLLFGADDALIRVNVDGTRALAAAAAGAPQVIHVSSLVAREPQLSPYAASKRAGEDLALSLLGDRVTVVRPPAVYGPGDRETLRLFQLAAASPILPTFDPRARIAAIHAQDAARQIAALAGSSPGTGPFALVDERPEGYGWRELMGTAAEAFGRRSRLVQVPGATIYAVASIVAFANSWRKNKAMITFGKVRELTHLDWGVRPNERAARAPASDFSLLSGFRQTIGWYRSQGWL
ncbi:MAG: NAD-dependent epimerase/dehydratase family protein [Phenylobacterium sp.]